MYTNRRLSTRKIVDLWSKFSAELNLPNESASIDSIRLGTLLRSEQGLITWGTLLSLLLLMILVSLASNVAIVVNQKMETQNSADAIAYSSSVWIARGMNSVSATNHVIGEMNALYSIHHALGGKWLDVHYNDRERNSGDWEWWIFPPPFDFGGIYYQLVNVGLDVAYWIADLAMDATEILSKGPPWIDDGPNPDEDHYDRVKKHPIADINSAIFEGKEILKFQMLLAYIAHTAGAATYFEGWLLFYEPISLPPGSAQVDGIAKMKAGAAAARTAKHIEDGIHRQYELLDRVESIAIQLAPAKLAIPGIIKAVNVYQQARTLVEIPTRVVHTAGRIARRTSCSGFALGDLPDVPAGGTLNVVANMLRILPSLPVELENATDEGRSQLIRATYPWVRKWRFNINLAFSVGAPTSRASDGFIKWTNRYARQSSHWLRTDTGNNFDSELTVINRRDGSTGEKGMGIQLYVVKELNNSAGKGDEVWNKSGLAGTIKADEIFSCMGFARSEPPTVMSRRFFRQENPRGIMCYSQAMIYNANSQQASSSGGDFQPAVGWDTLAWDHDQQRVREWENPNFFERLLDFSPMLPENEPKIKLNWQAKLTPVTVYKMTKTAPGVMGWNGSWRAAFLNARESQYLLQNH